MRWNLLIIVFSITIWNNSGWSMQVATPAEAESAATVSTTASQSTDAAGVASESATAQSSGETASESNDPAGETETRSVAPISQAVDDDFETIGVELPWDYSPYRVLIWLVSDNPDVTVSSIEQPLRKFLDRDYAAVWRVRIAEAPRAVATAAQRNMGGMDYDVITAADPVLAVKRDHKDAVRLRIPENVAQYVTKVYGTAGRIEEVKKRAAEKGDKTVSGVGKLLEVVEGDAMAVRDLWADEKTEAVLVSRGIASMLDNPEAKLILPDLTNLVSRAVEKYDKIFIVRVQADQVPARIEVVELDTLMRHFGPVAKMQAEDRWALPEAIGRTLTLAFAPVVRIDNAGQKKATGLLRAGGLIVDKDSPADLKVGDVLEPMTRKNDRNGKPIIIGPIDWAFLHVTDFEGRNVKMDFYAGRVGGLQGRKNKRTFRTALRVRPFYEASTLRLHLQRDPSTPMIGYELYERELDSPAMTFIGRTDWDGRLRITLTKDLFRLLYVKNGGAVLARLPIVPGLHEHDVADLSGDDTRLQAEAYIRGVQNSIIDLVAVRELFRARIHLRIERGEIEKAEALMVALKERPSNEQLANEMGKKQTDFINLPDLARSANQRAKVDEMFRTTRELLTSHINDKLVRDLAADIDAAKKSNKKD